MQITAIVLSCVLLGPTPPEMIGRAMELPAGNELSGRALTLLEAISPIWDARQQLGVTHAYWQLAAAVAEYNLRREQVEELDRLEVRPEDEAIARTARASATASLREAELAVVTAQHELAEATLSPATDPLPLPVDRPHVGPYRTRFDEIFLGRVAPPRIKMIDSRLPIHRRVIDARAEAVRAAEDALSAAREGYRLDQTRLERVLSCMKQQGRERRALTRSVCDYNNDIAEYALSVIGRPAGGEALVAMLIQSDKREPTLAPPKPSGKNVPTLAPPREKVRPIVPPVQTRPVVPVPREIPEAWEKSAVDDPVD
jgi:hypothetical protein